MPKFFYIARDKSGHKITGSQEASTQEEAINRLHSQDLIVISVLPEYKEGVIGGKAEPFAKKAKPTIKHFRVTNEDLVVFCRQLATLLGAGVTILNSLDIIARQIASKKLYNIIRRLQKNMESGLSFHEALAKHKKVFSELWINLVESGEASGNLAVILSRLASYLERNMSFKRK
ncbi:MAG: type II secretion system F family protein, partial [Candidatus Omnitrophota bacterium]